MDQKSIKIINNEFGVKFFKRIGSRGLIYKIFISSTPWCTLKNFSTPIKSVVCLKKKFILGM